MNFRMMDVQSSNGLLYLHHLELLSKDMNCRSSTLPEAIINERKATPLRPFNTPKLVVALSPKKQAGSSRKIPAGIMKTPLRDTAKTPPRAICRTPGTPARAPNTPTARTLRSGSKSRIAAPKLTTPRSKVPFLV
ncbi:hypothetical protein J437_LFUL013237 [Ladona fulva]|uniref:Uncharacterized protein n=1 Tax=Ladona fulva TaxID=123851 RepID=A0A8K0K3S2_LADFU|nr:hypothetical protein J437_LFUL013237 [Ladona fulva]